MSLNDNLTEDEKSLLEKIKNKNSIGNYALIKQLDWANDRYWEVRNKLIEKGVLETGRGKGGSVRKVDLEPVLDSGNIQKEDARESELQREAEADLYEPMLKEIKNEWAREQGFYPHEFHAEITAAQGRRETGGKWTRPDIVMAAKKRFTYVRSMLELITFEIKTVKGFDVTAIYEALAHRRNAHRAYVIVYVGKDKIGSFQSIIDDAQEEALRHGVGLIIAESPDAYATWNTPVEAKMHTPEPSKLNTFFSQSSKTLQEWVLINKDN